MSDKPLIPNSNATYPRILPGPDELTANLQATIFNMLTESRQLGRQEAFAMAVRIIKEIEQQAQTSCADFQSIAIERIEAFARGEL